MLISPICWLCDHETLIVDLAGDSVETGDMIVFDRDGVVAVPFDRINEVLSKLTLLQTA